MNSLILIKLKLGHIFTYRCAVNLNLEKMRG